MDESYLIDLRRKYSGKNLEKRIDGLQAALFRFESEKIMYVPRISYVKSAAVSLLIMTSIWALSAAIHGRYPQAVYSSSDMITIYIIAIAFFASGTIVGAEFWSKLSIEKARKVTLMDFLKTCECRVVCGVPHYSRQFSSGVYYPIHAQFSEGIPIEGGYYVGAREQRMVLDGMVA